jgi:superfamily II DNA or RNA helicase
LTHRQQLLSQWMAKLVEFLDIDEELPVLPERRGQKPRQSLIGQIGAGKDNPSCIIDVAIMQSLSSGGDVRACVEDYGMVIVDECHHVPAVSFEQILKRIRAKYVYGLTATPARRDGRHPIIFMHCGPVRYRLDARKEAEKRPFDHYVIPRFIGFRPPLDREEEDISIQELYSEIATDELRNQRIADDVVRSHENGRNTLVLTERTAHVETLAGKLREKIPNVITLTGGRGMKETGKDLARISDMPAGRQLTLVATGRYLGEGFDELRLDTLFLAMPISWKGTLQQYAGRLHRLFENKKEVQIYDYVDIHVRALEKMYRKRLAGYAGIGYRAKAESRADESLDIIFDNTNFLPVYHNDMMNTAREMVIVSPFVTRRRALQMLSNMEAALAKSVSVVVVTRPTTTYKDKDRAALKETLAWLQDAGVRLVLRSNIHQKFAVFDQKIVWYGSINLLSYGIAEESIMRLESPNIAQELMKDLRESIREVPAHRPYPHLKQIGSGSHTDLTDSLQR